jgi:hypothetical protein
MEAFRDWTATHAPPYLLLLFPPGHPMLEAPFSFRIEAQDMYIYINDSSIRKAVLHAVLVPASVARDL